MAGDSRHGWAGRVVRSPGAVEDVMDAVALRLRVQMAVTCARLRRQVGQIAALEA